MQAPFAAGALRYARNVAAAALTEEELALFTGALLLSPQRPGLSEPARVATLHRALHEAFQDSVSKYM